MTAAARACLDERSLATIFTQARTHYAWQEKSVPSDLLASIYDIARFGPTSANCSPMRIVFLVEAKSKERLLPTLSKGNVRKAESAPCVAIIAQDRDYLDRIPELFPAAYDARSWFAASPTSAAEHGLRNTMLQAAYFIIAARAVGLDCGPMSGFDAAAVNAEFFPDSAWTAVLLINVGYGSTEVTEPRKPRLSVAEACKFL
jgi:3-hydroxypropanoate dehydrogenase